MSTLSPTPHKYIYSSARIMATHYKAFVPHIANYIPHVDFREISIKAIDYGYTSIIERLGLSLNSTEIYPHYTTIQNWGYIFSNFGYEFVKLGPGIVNNITYKRGLIIDRDLVTLLVLFEPANSLELNKS